MPPSKTPTGHLRAYDNHRKHEPMKQSDTSKSRESPAALIDARIKELGDWRGVPVWYHDVKIICTGESYKNAVKLTFAKRAQLKDPKRLFNASLEGNLRRAIDLHEGDTIDAAAFTALIRAAIALKESG